MSWDYKEYNLDELGFLGRGKSKHRPRNELSLFGGDYPFFQTGDVKAATIHATEYSNTYTEKGLAQSKLWNKGTLLITIAANIAETAVLGIDACFPDSIVGFVPDKSKVNAYFVKYYIDFIKQEMQQISQGTTQDNLSLDKLRSFKFKVPNKKVVDEITKQILAYDNLIENNNRRIAILEDMAQSLYKEWFVKFRFPGYQDCKFKETELGLIPEGWVVKSLEEICKKVIDGTHDSPKPADEGFPLVTGKHIKNGFIDFSGTYLITQVEHKKVLARSKPEHGDILFSNIGTLGSATIVDATVEYSIKNVALFKIKRTIDTHYLYIFLTGKLNMTNMMGQASGTSQKFLSLKFLREFKLLWPEQVILTLFSQEAVKFFELRNNLHSKNINLRNQRDLLLPKLISGSVEV